MKTITQLRAEYAPLLEAYITAKNAVEAKGKELDAAITAAGQYRVGAVVTGSSGKEFKVISVNGSGGRLWGRVTPRNATGEWSKRDTTIELKAEG